MSEAIGVDPFPGFDVQDTLRAGTVLEGRYEVLRVCGYGGMSTVYVARDLRFSHVERLCAIKEMVNRHRDHQTQMLRLANFEREASLLATLSHPAIPKIYDYFSSGGLIYLVLEFIEGEDLERLISNSAIPIEQDVLIEWSLQILDVLSYLHEHQPEPIVFRDLKPSNIMLRVDGSITLIDFGIARTFQPMQRGTMIGTEGYAPPEQYRGIAEPRGDIYAMGATLHHLATKSDPRTEAPFTFAQRPPTQLNPKLSPALEAVILRSVSYAPGDRFPSAAAMAQALIDIRDGKKSARPITNFGVSDGQQPNDLNHIFEYVDEPNAERIIWSVQTGDEVRGTATISSPLAYIGSYDNHLYALNVNDGAIVWRFGTHRGVVSKPLAHDDMIVIGSEDHAVYAVNARGGRIVWSFRTAMPVRSSVAAFGHTAVIVGSDDGYCYCLDAVQGTMLWRHRSWGPIRSTPLIVDDRIVLGSDDGSVHCLAAPDGRQLWRVQLGRPVLSSATASGDIVAIGCTDGKVYGLDLGRGAAVWDVRTGGPIIASPRYNGDSIYIGSTDGKFYSISAHDGTLNWSQQLATQITSSVSIRGNRGYVGTIDGNVVCVDLTTGSTIWSYRVGSPIVSTPAIDETVVVVGALNGKIYGLRS